jgi:hypothetical protein
MKKTQKIMLAVLLALMAGSLITTGCSLDPEKVIEYVNVTKDKIIGFDAVVSTETELTSALTNASVVYILVKSDITLTAAKTIPAGKTVYLFADLNTGGKVLTVNGSLAVADTGTLTATDDTGEVIVSAGGSVQVEKGGKLSIETVDSVNDGGDPTATTVIGTRAKIATGGTLALSTAFTTTDDIQAVLDRISTGIVSTATNLKPSEIANTTFTGLSAAKQLSVSTGATAETESTLTIPANLTIVSTDDLDSVTTLTVNGALTASSAILHSSGVTLTMGAGSKVTFKAKIINSGSSVGSSGALTLMGATEIKGLTLGGMIIIPTPPTTVNITGPLVYPTMGYRFTGGGKIKTSGEGKIDTHHGVFTTGTDGVSAANFMTLVTPLIYETMSGTMGGGGSGGALLNSIALNPTYTSDPLLGIGSADPSGTGATTIEKNGTEITFARAEITFVGTPTATAVSGIDAGSLSAGDFTLSLDTSSENTTPGSEKGATIKIADSDFSDSSAADDTYVVVSFSNVVLTINNLYTTFDTFNVGVKTRR